MPATTRAGGAVTVRPGVKIGPVGRRLAAILGHYPRKGAIYITSAFRPEERGSHHGGPSYGGSPTAAIDIGGGVNATGSRNMRDVAKWLYDHFAADTVELIHTTPFNTDRGFYVKNQRKYPGGGPYAGATAAQHRHDDEITGREDRPRDARRAVRRRTRIGRRDRPQRYRGPGSRRPMTSTLPRTATSRRRELSRRR